MEWDSTEEALQLGHTPPIEERLQEILRPRRLFQDENDTDDTHVTLTQESSDDEVFFTDNLQQVKGKTKLLRRNAMKRRNKKAVSEPRITRNMIRTERFDSRSHPTSPSNVLLHRPQDLNEVLHPRKPLVPETVRLDGTVQTLNGALQDDRWTNSGTRRDSTRRPRQSINYLTFHKHGRKT